MLNVQHLIKAVRRQWIVLGIGVLGLVVSTTVLTFFLPVVLDSVTDSGLAIGFAVGVEGVAALTVPLLVGQASDRTWTRFGRRMPYLLAATPLVFAAMLAVALLHTYWLIVAAVLVFFVGYYAYYTAYQALYPDTLPPDEYGRAWGYLSLFQGLGVAVALLGGGALLGVGLGAPFIAAAFFFVLIAGVTAGLVKEQRARPGDAERSHSSATPPRLRRVLLTFFGRLRDDPKLRWFLAAHFCWEYTLAAIRAFVILYMLNGLNLSPSQIVPVMAVVIVAYLLASVVSGQVIDRPGRTPHRYAAGVITVYAVCMLTVGLSTNWYVLTVVTPVGVFAGVATLLLAYPILLRITPPERRGEYTGYFQFNRGLALLVGTSLTGGLIDLFGGYFPATDGLQVLWLSTAALAFVSLPLFLQLSRRGLAQPA